MSHSRIQKKHFFPSLIASSGVCEEFAILGQFGHPNGKAANKGGDDGRKKKHCHLSMVLCLSDLTARAQQAFTICKMVATMIITLFSLVDRRRLLGLLD
jgi:hypothetical protein